MVHIWTKDEVGVPWNRFKPSSKIVLLTILRRCFFVDHLCYFFLVFVMLSCASVYWCLVVTCWERADPFALVCISNCKVVTFPLVSGSGVVLDCIDSWSLPFLFLWTIGHRVQRLFELKHHVTYDTLVHSQTNLGYMSSISTSVAQ